MKSEKSPLLWCTIVRKSEQQHMPSYIGRRVICTCCSPRCWRTNKTNDRGGMQKWVQSSPSPGNERNYYEEAAGRGLIICDTSSHSPGHLPSTHTLRPYNVCILNWYTLIFRTALENQKDIQGWYSPIYHICYIVVWWALDSRRTSYISFTRVLASFVALYRPLIYLSPKAFFCCSLY